jgi:hypothetical protein
MKMTPLRVIVLFAETVSPLLVIHKTYHNIIPKVLMNDNGRVLACGHEMCFGEFIRSNHLHFN